MCNTWQIWQINRETICQVYFHVFIFNQLPKADLTSVITSVDKHMVVETDFLEFLPVMYLFYL